MPTHEQVERVSDGPLLSLKSVGKLFGHNRVLGNVSFNVAPGEVVALMGENGAGKSTLVKIISGVHTEYEGEVWFKGRMASYDGPRSAERDGVGIIHQELNIVPERTAADNIFLGREPRRARGTILNRKRMRTEAMRHLSRLGVSLDMEAKAGRLRLGEQQLIEIARALSLNASLLIMDEPTSALSLAEAERLFAVIRALSAEGVAVIYISHRMDEIARIATRTIVLRDGALVLDAPRSQATRNDVIYAMVGRELQEFYQEPKAFDGDVILSLRGTTVDALQASGRTKRLVDGVDLEVRAGEIVGIAGLLGSGRTALLEAIYGVPDLSRGGSMVLKGWEKAINSPSQAKRAGIAFVAKDRKGAGLILNQSIEQNFLLPIRSRQARYGFIDWRGGRSIAEKLRRMLRVKCVGVDQPVGDLSGGNQQKVAIGKWLECSPRLLLLDEPTRGVDIGAKEEIYDLLIRLAGQGLAIMLISSELPELLSLSHRIVVLREGKVSGVLSRSQFTQAAVLALASLEQNVKGATA